VDHLFLAVSIGISLLIFLCLYRAIFGPTVFDRIIGAGFVGTKTSVLICLIGFIYGRIDMFVDLALAYSMLNFIGTIIVSKFFVHKGAR
jgi:multicomponent Na+:H+ antiporter subunit F